MGRPLEPCLERRWAGAERGVGVAGRVVPREALLRPTGACAPFSARPAIHVLGNAASGSTSSVVIAVRHGLPAPRSMPCRTPSQERNACGSR